jgi:hypothetical protein
MELPTGLSHFFVTKNDVPVGDSYSVQNWQFVSASAAYTIYSSPLTGALVEALPVNHDRAVLRIGKKNILFRDYAEAPTDSYWYDDNGILYVAWHVGAGLFNAQKVMYVIPQAGFFPQGDHQGLILDLASDFQWDARSDVAIHVLRPDVEWRPVVRVAAVSTTLPEVYALALDGNELRLPTNGTAWRYLPTRSVTRTISAGSHVITFSDRTLARVFIERSQAPSTQTLLRITDLRRQTAYAWTLAIPARSNTTTLGLLDAYNPHWQVSGAPILKHFVLDGYANGWSVPAGPATRIEVYYSGQIFVVAGLWISIAGFAALFLLAAAQRLRRPT